MRKGRRRKRRRQIRGKDTTTEMEDVMRGRMEVRTVLEEDGGDEGEREASRERGNSEAKEGEGKKEEE